MFKAIINDRSYTNWIFYESKGFKQVELKINPSEHKILHNDFFSIDETTEKPFIVHSSIRFSTSIAGVLILKGNKTYGRNSKGKLLYKCIPDDIHLPCFLIPYDIKTIGFSKVFTNLYVTFSFFEWTDKHPHGLLNQNIGPVNILNNFYEYQLYCKSLNVSINKFTKDTSKALKEKHHNASIEDICKKYPSIKDRTNQEEWNIFTIDSAKCLDFDDAFSIKTWEKNEKITLLSIYISNVTILLDSLNLWNSFSRRVSTIYFPDKKRPMLPTMLSDMLCSLQENNTRIAFIMDIFIHKDTFEVIDVKYSNAKIKVKKNFVYESFDLLKNKDYIYLFETTKNLTKHFKYINNVRDSNDVVGYLMILMNYYSAIKLLKNNNGVFRSTIIKKEITIPNDVPEDVSKFIKIWKSSYGQYINGEEINKDNKINIRHELLEMEAYIHITSPIRRLVDLLNIIKFQENDKMIKLSNDATQFYNNWINELEYINTTMRSIRKVQCDCNLLDLCSNNPNILDKNYDGYLFDKVQRDDGLYQFIVFLPDLKLTSKIIIRDNVDNFEKRQFNLYLFNDEEKFKKKIRLQII